MEEKKVCRDVVTRQRIARKEYKDLMNRLSRIEGQVREFEGWLKKAHIVRIF